MSTYRQTPVTAVPVAVSAAPVYRVAMAFAAISKTIRCIAAPAIIPAIPAFRASMACVDVLPDRRYVPDDASTQRRIAPIVAAAADHVPHHGSASMETVSAPAEEHFATINALIHARTPAIAAAADGNAAQQAGAKAPHVRLCRSPVSTAPASARRAGQSAVIRVVARPTIPCAADLAMRPLGEHDIRAALPVRPPPSVIIRDNGHVVSFDILRCSLTVVAFAINNHSLYSHVNVFRRNPAGNPLLCGLFYGVASM